MPADPVTDGAWYQSLPAEYRDRVQFDPLSGEPSHIDVAAGDYDVPGELSNVDRRRCKLPPRSVRPGLRQPWDPPA